MRFFSGLAIYLTVFFTSVSAFGEFKWCQGLRDFSLEKLSSFQKPSYPHEYIHEAHDREDGTWIIDAPLFIVWAAFVSTPMKTVWSSRMIEYGFAMKRGQQTPIDESKWPGLEVGMRFYMNTLGEPTGYLCNMGFGFEVTEIQPQRLIKYDYLEFSPAYGEQWLTFEAVGEGQTKIHWQTRYLGKDRVIDLLYRVYHYEAVRSFMNSATGLINDYLIKSDQKTR